MSRARTALLLTAALSVTPLAACSDTTEVAEASAPAGGGAAAEPSTISPAEARALLAGRDDVVVIDVRTPEEFADGHLPDARNINLQGADFEAQVSALDRAGTYVVYCRTGNRSAQAAAVMAGLGFTDVRDLGGIGDWAAAGGVVVR